MLQLAAQARSAEDRGGVEGRPGGGRAANEKVKKMRHLRMRVQALTLVWAALLGCATAALHEMMRPRRPAVAPDQLSRIRRAGVLRVGTTGDYDPFSFVDPQGAFAGSMSIPHTHSPNR